MIFTLNVLYKNGQRVNAPKLFNSVALIDMSISAVEEGTALVYYDYINFLPVSNNYIVSETPQQIEDLINKSEPGSDGTIKVFDYDIDGNLIYLGGAIPGSLESEAVWQISKFLYDADGNVSSILYANGNTLFTNIWNNRVSLSYS